VLFELDVADDCLLLEAPNEEDLLLVLVATEGVAVAFPLFELDLLNEEILVENVVQNKLLGRVVQLETGHFH
jgi:hypothetical protein